MAWNELRGDIPIRSNDKTIHHRTLFLSKRPEMEQVQIVRQIARKKSDQHRRIFFLNGLKWLREDCPTNSHKNIDQHRRDFFLKRPEMNWEKSPSKNNKKLITTARLFF